jgi:hypothetical protein
MCHSQNWVCGSRDVRNHSPPAVSRTYLSNFGTSKPVFRQMFFITTAHWCVSYWSERQEMNYQHSHIIFTSASGTDGLWSQHSLFLLWRCGPFSDLTDLLNPGSSFRWCHLRVPCLEPTYGISPHSILKYTPRLSYGSSDSGISSHYLFREAESQPIESVPGTIPNVVTSNRLRHCEGILRAQLQVRLSFTLTAV